MCKKQYIEKNAIKVRKSIIFIEFIPTNIPISSPFNSAYDRYVFEILKTNILMTKIMGGHTLSRV